MYPIPVQNLIIAGLLVAFPAGSNAQHWNEHKPEPHQWPTGAVDMHVPDKFGAYDLVVQDQAIEIQNGLYKSHERGYEERARFLLRRRFHVNTPHGSELLKKETILAGAFFHEVSVFHARLIKADGTVVDETGRGARLNRVDLGDGLWGDATISFTDLLIAPGEELEFVIEQIGNGIIALRESMVQGEYPIAHASILVRTTPDLPPLIETFNGFPEPEVDPVGKANTQRWSFDMLDPLPLDPLALVKNCVPFFSMTYAPPAGVSMSSFDRRYPRDIIVGRKNVHAFTNYVNAVKSRYGMHDIMGPMNEVIRFLHDSVKVVPTSEIDVELSIGQCFAERRISRQKLVVLYRALLNILDVQLVICRSRSRYEGRFGDRNDNWSFQEFLAFEDEDKHTLHFIVPNTTHQRFLLDEFPVDLNGAIVEALPYKDSGINGQPFSIPLPTQAASRNFKQERIMLELAEEGIISSAVLRGSIGGFLPSALEADTVQDALAGRTQRLNAWVQRRFALDGLDRAKLSVIDTVLPRVWKYESVGYKGQPARLAPQDSSAYHFVARPFVNWYPILDAALDTMQCPKLLPFTFHRRTDLVLHTDRPISVAGIPSTFNRRVSNALGEFSASYEQPDPGTLVLHFDLALFNDVIDTYSKPWVEELQNAIDESLRAHLSIRY